MERKLVAIAVSSALALPMAAQAVEFSVSGHVNRAIISVDGGENDGEVQHVDADSSQTRFRFSGSEELENGATAGVHLSLGGPDDWQTRQAHVSLSGAFGDLTLGHAEVPSDGANYPDFGVAFLGGVSNSCSYHAAGPACQEFTPDRQGILRYDSPPVGAASISASAGENEFWDVAASVAGSFGDAGYDLRIAYVGEHDATETPMDDPQDHPHQPASVTVAAGDQTMASATIMFGQGSTLGLAWAQDHKNDNDYQFVGLSHTYGDGTVGVYYKRGQEDGTDGSLWGVGVGHELASSVEAYAGYRLMEEDGAEDESVLLAGMRVKFN